MTKIHWLVFLFVCVLLLVLFFVDQTDVYILSSISKKPNRLCASVQTSKRHHCLSPIIKFSVPVDLQSAGNLIVARFCLISGCVNRALEYVRLNAK